MVNKEDYYLEQLDKARKELNGFYQKEFIRCCACKQRAQRQKWTLQTTTTREEDSGYPVSYTTYWEYSMLCPRCNTAIKLGSIKPKHDHFFINVKINR